MKTITNFTSYLSGLSCSSCGKSFEPETIQTFCLACNAPLLAEYGLDSLKTKVDRDEIKYRTKGIWRWFELLPVRNKDNIISLGEGDTALLRLDNIGKQLGLKSLFLKDESQNPTGSFKARGISVAVSKAVEFGIHKIVIPSAGNAGGALAAYAARAGIESLIYIPKTTPLTNIFESKFTGANVELIDGLITEAGNYAQIASQTEGWFNLSTFKEPYRVEGKKIMGYEIAESFNWELPDIIIYPTGGGTGLVGMWKAFLEMEQLGWLENQKLPKLVSVQSAGCAPVVKAFHSGQTNCEIWENARTIATGLCVPISFADRLILKYVRNSSGIAISVDDQDIIKSRDQLAKKEGIFACPEGAATLAGLEQLQRIGFVKPEETIVLFNTGSGLKYIGNDYDLK